eukprot:IDg4305t1
MTRPGGNSTLQRAVFSGHKRFHCLMYQTITTPDGLIFNLFGPIEGRHADAFLYMKSDIESALRNTAVRGQDLTEIEMAHNSAMNSARVSVEWSYGEIKNIFVSQDFPRKLQVRKLPVALL